jgi:putative flippase GtrA
LIKLLTAHQEKFLFIISGGIQYLLDMLFFVLLVLVFGNNLNINIFSRVCAGIIGFYINGYAVFKALRGKSLNQQLHSAMKFLILLALMTALSSIILSFFTHKSGLHFIVAKGSIEIFLSVTSFCIQKYFVYRQKNTQ